VCVQIYTCILYRLVLLYYTEIDPCKEDNGGCSPDASCSSTDDGVKCTCNEGFTGNGQDCTGESILTINTPQFNIRNAWDSADPGSGEESPSVGSRGEASVGCLGDPKAGGRLHSQSSGVTILKKVECVGKNDYEHVEQCCLYSGV